MARKQSDYLAALLTDDDSAPALLNDSGGETIGNVDVAPHASIRTERSRGSTLLERESALARVASGEVRQVTQLLLDPARVKVWPGNARSYAHLNEVSCRELIDSIIAEAGQKIPVIVRRIVGDPEHDYEVIAGTRRHWTITWLRAHSYPDMQLLAQVAQLDDEAAFRFADIENRARADVSDLERARNYASALTDHYAGHQTRMADRLNISKGQLSKLLKVASIPDAIIAAFASPAEIQLKPAYPLAQALDDKDRASLIRKEATRLAREQASRKSSGHPPLPVAEVLRMLLAASDRGTQKIEPLVITSRFGRPLASVQTLNRQGLVLRLHSGSGADQAEVIDAIQRVLIQLEQEGRGLQR